jgi:hypothetical protein
LKRIDYSLDSTSKFSIWVNSAPKFRFILSRQGVNWKLTSISIPFEDEESKTNTDLGESKIEILETKKEPVLKNIPEIEVHSLSAPQLAKKMNADESKILKMDKFISLLNQPNGDIRCGVVGPNEKLKANMKSESYYLVTTAEGERGWIHFSWLQENP